MSIWDEGPIFWDITGPLLIIIYILLILWSISCVLNKKHATLIGISIFQWMISIIFLFSIGKILVIIPTLNMAYLLLIEVVWKRNSSTI